MCLVTDSMQVLAEALLSHCCNTTCIGTNKSCISAWLAMLREPTAVVWDVFVNSLQPELQESFFGFASAHCTDIAQLQPVMNKTENTGHVLVLCTVV